MKEEVCKRCQNTNGEHKPGCPSFRPQQPDISVDGQELCGNCIRCLEGVILEGMPFPIPVLGSRMILCPDCGNKRCPKATDHRNACTDSNESGQPGSDYPAWHPPQGDNVESLADAAERFCDENGSFNGVRLATPTEMAAFAQQQTADLTRRYEEMVARNKELEDALAAADKTINEEIF